MVSHRDLSLSWRNTVILYLHQLGFAQATTVNGKLNIHAWEPGNDSSIAGLPAWTLVTRRESSLDLSGSINAAASRAAANGTDLYAVVLYRRGHEVDEAYVAMPLAQFAAVLAKLHPDAVAVESVPGRMRT
jgi:hypothetical protein